MGTNMSIKMGQKIKRFRKSLGLTLQEVATKVGSSKSYIWDIENKNIQPSAKKMVAIADVLKITVEFLLDDTKEKMMLSDEEEYFLKKYRKLSAGERKKLEQVMDILFVYNWRKL
jgi:transcriptional regulator with XRE-family HTH domain